MHGIQDLSKFLLNECNRLSCLDNIYEHNMLNITRRMLGNMWIVKAGSTLSQETTSHVFKGLDFGVWVWDLACNPEELNLRELHSVSLNEKGKNKQISQGCMVKWDNSIEAILAYIKFSLYVSYYYFLVQSGEITVGWWDQGRYTEVDTSE